MIAVKKNNLSLYKNLSTLKLAYFFISKNM